MTTNCVVENYCNWKHHPERYLNDNSAWMDLVKRYSDGRKSCSCGEAWCINAQDPHVAKGRYGSYDFCYAGCGANQRIARNEIACCVLKEIRDLQEKVDRLQIELDEEQRKQSTRAEEE